MGQFSSERYAALRWSNNWLNSSYWLWLYAWENGLQHYQSSWRLGWCWDYRTSGLEIFQVLCWIFCRRYLIFNVWMKGNNQTQTPSQRLHVPWNQRQSKNIYILECLIFIMGGMLYRGNHQLKHGRVLSGGGETLTITVIIIHNIYYLVYT